MGRFLNLGDIVILQLAVRSLVFSLENIHVQARKLRDAYVAFYVIIFCESLFQFLSFIVSLEMIN